MLQEFLNETQYGTSSRSATGEEVWNAKDGEGEKAYKQTSGNMGFIEDLQCWWQYNMRTNCKLIN